MKPKILHIIIGKDFGGRAIRTRELSQYLISIGFHVVVCGNCLERFDKEFKNNGICFIGIKGLKGQLSILSDVFSLWRLIKFIRTENFDIVHTHTVKAGLIGRIAARIAGVPIVIHHFAGFGHEKFRSKLVAKFYLLVERILDNLSDVSICVSKSVRNTALKYKISKKEKLFLVYNGIDVDKFVKKIDKKKQRSILAIPDNCRIVCYVGRLAEDKGIEYFLRAVQGIIKEFTDVVFLLVGDGSLRNKLEKMTCGLYLNQSVIFAGYRNDIPEVLSIIDILVLPSLREGFGGSIVEAMAASKPCVGTNVGGIPEVIDNTVTGFVVPPKDPDALSKAVTTLLKYPEFAREMGIQGRKKVDELFSLKRMCTDTTKIYYDLLRKYQI